MHRNLRQLTAALSGVLLCGFTCSAAEPVLVISDQGYQWLSVGVEGTPVLKPVQQVIDLRTAPGPTPPGPTPPAPTGVAQRIEAAARKINDPAGALILAKVYTTVADSNLPPETSIQALKLATDVAIAAYERERSPGAAARWQPFRDEVSRLLGELQSQGKLSSAAEVTQFLKDAGKGLEAAAAGAEVDVLQLIQLIIPLILEILRLFAPR